MELGGEENIESGAGVGTEGRRPSRAHTCPWHLSHVGSRPELVEVSAGASRRSHRAGPGHMDDTLAVKASGLHLSGHTTA